LAQRNSGRREMEWPLGGRKRFVEIETEAEGVQSYEL
jgi:hypothetical protein